MRQGDWAAAEHLLSPFSSPFFRMKLLYDYGFSKHVELPTCIQRTCCLFSLTFCLFSHPKSLLSPLSYLLIPSLKFFLSLKKIIFSIHLGAPDGPDLLLSIHAWLLCKHKVLVICEFAPDLFETYLLDSAYRLLMYVRMYNEHGWKWPSMRWWEREMRVGFYVCRYEYC